MKEYLVRFAQVHESFRKAELFALAEIAGAQLEIVEYQEDVSGSRYLPLHGQPNLAPVRPPVSLSICHDVYLPTSEH